MSKVLDIGFATANAHKIAEVQEMLPSHIRIRSLADLGWHEDIPETADTLQGNALIKTRTIADALEIPCFADDTGLEIDALQGNPGVLSARYAGENRNASDNMQKVLDELGSRPDRQAQFRTVVALMIDGGCFYFEGIVRGVIALEPMGDGGFGYDPIFIPEGHDLTFGQLPASVKQKISHRARAITRLVDFLKVYARRKSRG